MSVLQHLHVTVALLLLSSHLTCGQQKLANVDFLGLGYDAVKGDPHNNWRDPGFRQKVFEFTYDNHTISGDGRWLIPDGTQALRTLVCSYSAETSLVQGTASFRNSLAADVTVGGEVWALHSFSASTSYQRVYNGTSNQKRSYIETVAKCNLYEVKIDHYVPFRVTRNLVNAVRTLPTMNATDIAYKEFIQTFGTHFLTSMIMGAKAVVRSEFDQMAWTKMEQTNVNVQTAAKASFKAFTGSLSGGTTQERMSAATFESLRTSHVEYYLGSRPSNDGRWETWAQSAEDSPYPTAYALRQLSEILTMQYFPGENESLLAQKKLNLEDTYSKYCNNHSPACLQPSPDFTPVRVDLLETSIRETQEVQCRPGYSLLSCGHRNPTKAGKSEVFRYVQPMNSNTCRCYDYYGMNCVLWCGNAASGFTINSGSGTTFSVACPAGKKVMGCHLVPHFNRNEGWRRLYPRNDGSACEFYDYFGATGYVTCAANIQRYEVRSAYGTGLWSVKCSAGNYVLGCGIVPAGGGPERWRDHYVSAIDQCTCYDHYGSTCYATCGTFA